MIEQFIKILRDKDSLENGVLKISDELCLILADELERLIESR